MDAFADLNSIAQPPVVALNLPPSQASPSNVVEQLKSQLESLAALTDLISRIEATRDLQAACQILVDRLQVHLEVEQVFLGLCGESSPACRLKAISHCGSFDPRDDRSLAAQAVLQEVIARGEAAKWPVTHAIPQGGMLAHRQFSRANGNVAIASGILRDANGQLRGAWLVTGAAERILNEKVTGFLRGVETPIASALHLIARAQSGRLQQAFRNVRAFLNQQRGQMIVTAAVVLGFVLCLPFPYHPDCECTIEPVTRRYIAAPFDGPLEKALVQPGDEVEAGELLARMDGKENRWELSGARAELHRADKERAGHMTAHEVGRAEVARYEVDRLRVRTELLEHRDQNLEIRSPIAGIVISGDLEDAEGMPLEVGQTLFEIAPLDEMIVELAVAEDDFAHVRSGMETIIRLDAYPLRRFAATIERIHPRAEIIDDKNVFLAEVRLENKDGSLRPGMRGSAKIEAEPHPLGWILFRRPYTALIAWLGW